MFGLVVWFLFQVREVLGSIPRTALVFGSVADLVIKFSDARFRAWDPWVHAEHFVPGKNTQPFPTQFFIYVHAKCRRCCMPPRSRNEWTQNYNWPACKSGAFSLQIPRRYSATSVGSTVFTDLTTLTTCTTRLYLVLTSAIGMATAMTVLSTEQICTWKNWLDRTVCVT